MRPQAFFVLGLAAVLMGCAQPKQHARGASETDHNVLTGGPISGTTLQDLPQPVREALQRRVPHAEVADIDKIERNGKVVYGISFSQPGKNSKIYFYANGQSLSDSQAEKIEGH